MSVNIIGGVLGNQQPNIQRTSDKVQAVIATLIGGSNSAAGGDVAKLSIAAQLQSSLSGLKQLSENLAQAVSLAQIASSGVQQIQDGLGQLQSLAKQAANPNLNDGERNALNQQFQQVVGSIDNLVQGTSFNGQPLLNGNLTGDNVVTIDQVLGDNGNDGAVLSIASLATKDLFGGQSLNISSADGAKAADQILTAALSQVGQAGATVASFQQNVNYAAATVDSASFNQEAAISNLSDTDFANAASQLSLANIQQNLSTALAAQGNLLNPALLNLIG